MIFHPSLVLKALVPTIQVPEIHSSSSLGHVILSDCPSLLRSFKPTPYVFNGHFHTLVCAIKNVIYTNTPNITYHREKFYISKKAYVALDFATSDNKNPLVLLLHGLSGDSSEYYIRSCVSQLLGKDFNVVVMNARGCGNSTLETPQSYSASYTHDLSCVVKHLSRNHKTIIAVGFSAGANILVKYLGEGDDLLFAAVAIGNPFDLTKTSINMQSTMLHRHVYNPILTYYLKALALRNTLVFKTHPDICMTKVAATTTVQEFDHELTIKMFGHRDLTEYYESGSSRVFLKDVKCPLLCLHALDDPICPATALPTREEILENENLMLVTTSCGGHFGFCQGPMGATCWVDDVVAEYCEAIVKHHVVREEARPERVTEQKVTLVSELEDTSDEDLISWNDPSTYLALGTVAILSYSHIKRSLRM